MSPSRRPTARRAEDLHVNERRRRKRRRLERARRRRRVALVAILAIVALGVGATIAGTASVFAFGSSCDLASLRPVGLGQNSVVYASDGSLLGVIPSERNRQPVPLEQMSSWIPRATVAIEDRRFYDHGGVDVEGIARALWEDVRAGKVVQGGSTITQQLVRNLYISREQTLERKVKEACLAIKLNRAWSKQRILATYINLVPYGNLAYGIEAASQTYFSKHARELNLPQAALLAGLPQAPSSYEPFGNPDKARARRNQVLAAMVGSGAITRAQYDWASTRGLGLKPGRLYKTIRQPYFFSYVRDELVREYGAATVHGGGLKVYTTINPGWQRVAGRAIRSILPYRDDPAAALISIDPKNGRDPRDDGGDAGPDAQSVQPALPGAAAARLHLQDLRAGGSGGDGRRPGRDLVQLRALLLQAHSRRRLRHGRGRLVVRDDLRRRLLRVLVVDERHPPLRQHGLRAADPRRRPGARGGDGAQARCPFPARRQRRLRPVDGARRDPRLADGPGIRVRDPRRGRHLQRADGDQASRTRERQDRRSRQAGASPGASACSRTGSPTRSRRCSSRT